MKSRSLKDEGFSLSLHGTQRVIYFKDWLSDIIVITFTMGAWPFQPGPGTSCSSTNLATVTFGSFNTWVYLSDVTLLFGFVLFCFLDKFTFQSPFTCG